MNKHIICFIDRLLNLTPNITTEEKKQKAMDYVFNMDVLSAIRHVYHVQSM